MDYVEMFSNDWNGRTKTRSEELRLSEAVEKDGEFEWAKGISRPQVLSLMNYICLVDKCSLL